MALRAEHNLDRDRAYLSRRYHPRISELSGGERASRLRSRADFARSICARQLTSSSQKKELHHVDSPGSPHRFRLHLRPARTDFYFFFIRPDAGGFPRIAGIESEKIDAYMESTRSPGRPERGR